MKRKVIALVAVGLMLAAGLGGCLGGEKAPPKTPGKGWIYGSAVDNATSAPIVGATVAIADRTATTDSEGKYEILNLDPKIYSATCEATNYAKQVQENISVEADQGTEVIFRLMNSTVPQGAKTGTFTTFVNESDTITLAVHTPVATIVQTEKTQTHGYWDVTAGDKGFEKFGKLFKVTITWQKGAVTDDLNLRTFIEGGTGYSVATPKTVGDHMKYYEIPCSSPEARWKFGVMPVIQQETGVENNMHYTILIQNNAA